MYLQVLLDAGCDVNLCDASGRTALHYAAHTATGVTSLLDAGADVNAQDRDGCTPLLMAAAEGLDNVVRTLVHTGRCDVNVKQVSS